MRSIKDMLQSPEVRKVIEEARERVERYEDDYAAVELTVEALEQTTSTAEAEALIRKLAR